MLRHKRLQVVFIVVAVVTLSAALVWFLLKPASPVDAPVVKGPQSSGRLRPGVVYKPTALPLRHAERPDLSALSLKVSTKGDEEEDEDVEDEDLTDVADDEEEIVLPEPISPDDPALATMANERKFSELVWSLVENPPDDLAAQTAEWLVSDAPENRALAGVVLFLTDTLSDEVLDRVADDADPLVPLTVFDWVRDFGSDEEILNLRNGLEARELSPEYLLEVAKASASTIGGGRSALDLWLAKYAGEAVPVDSLASLVTASDVSYDVRAQAFYKLLEPETKMEAVKALDSFTGGLSGENGLLLSQLAEKWN